MQIRFLVTHEAPNARLSDSVIHPHAFVKAAGSKRLHGEYYITKQILPALARLFTLLGVDVLAWYNEMPKPMRLLPHKRPLTSLPLSATPANLAAASHHLTTIDQFYMSRHCIVCDALTSAKEPICQACRQNPALTTAVLKVRNAHRKIVMEPVTAHILS